MKSQKPRVYYTHYGRASFTRLMRYTSPFPVNLFRFPYDIQERTFRYSSWAYDNASIDIDPPDSKLTKEDMITGWKISNSSIARREVNYDGFGMDFVVVDVKVTLRREPHFYVMALVLPGLFLSSLPLVIFCLPIEGNDKVGHGKLDMLSSNPLNFL